MFHVVYSRDYWDTEDQGTFTNTWTLYRNVSYFKLREMQKAIPSLLKNADKTYAEYESKQEHKSDPTQFHKSEVYVVDSSDYFKTYKDMYPDSYMGPSGLIPEKEDYFHSYGQKCQFMLIKDDDEAYTWFGKDWTQEMIDAEYKKREELRA
jgi:hypothetical protein